MSEKKETPPRLHALYIILAAVGVVGFFILASWLADLGLHAKNWWLLFPVLGCVGLVLLGYAIIGDQVYELGKSRERAAERRQAEAQAPHIKRWAESLLDPALQPKAKDITPTVYEPHYPGDPAFEYLNEMGLAIFQEPGEHGARWVGLLDEAQLDHARWFLSENPHKPRDWRICNREFFPEEHLEEHPPGSETTLFAGLMHLQRDAFNVSLDLIRARLPKHKEDWLFRCVQTFGSGSTTELIALLPDKVAWASVHQIIHHTDAWRVENDMQDMPLNIILRTHGLGRVLKRFDAESLHMFSEPVFPIHDGL